MSSSVDTETIQPRKRVLTCDNIGDEATSPKSVDQAAQSPHSEDISGLSHVYSQRREACAVLPGLRIFAASALVVGLMLATAPAALAQVKHLVGTAPAAFVRNDPTLDAPTRDDSGMSTGADAQGNRVSQLRRAISALTALIRWDGTSRAFRDAYSLLVHASNRAYPSSAIVAASSYLRQVA